MRISFFVLLFFISLGVRAGFFYAFLENNPCMLAFDSGHYNSVACNIAQGKGIVNNDGTPHFYRLPGYPLFLASCYKIFGCEPRKALYVQIVLASLIPLLIFALAVTLFPANILVAQVASLISCFHVGFIIFSGLVMSETLFLLLFLLFALFFLRREFFCAGLFLGLASLVRPIGHYILVVSLVYLLLSLFLKNKQVLRACATSLIFFTGWLLVVFWWLLRNYLLTGQLFFHTLSGPHLLNHGAVPVIMTAEGCSHGEAKKQVYACIDEALVLRKHLVKDPVSEVEYMGFAEVVSHKILHANKYATFSHCLRNALKTSFSLYSSELLFIDSDGKLPEYENGRTFSQMIKRFVCPQVNNRWVAYVIYFEMIMFLFLLLGFLWACVRYFFNIYNIALERVLDPRVREDDVSSGSMGDGVSIVKNQGTVVWLCCVSVLVIALSSLCGFARLRLPIEPFFIMVSSSAWITLLHKKRIKT